MSTVVFSLSRRRICAAVLLAAPLAVPLKVRADPGHVHELAPASAGTLTVVGPWELTGLEPSRSGFMFTRMEVAQTLLDADDQGQLRAGAASSWEVSKDGRTWRFFVRQGNRFHDGSALTANTALVSLLRAWKTPGVLQLAGITDLYAERGAIVVQLRQPFAPLPYLFTQYSTQLLAPSSFDADGRVTAIIGSGPYRIKSITLPQMFETEFADTWNGDAPAVRRARYISVSRAETRALMAQSRQADLAFTLDPPSIRRLQRQRGVSLVAQNLPRTTFLKLNAAHPFLRDERVRQAISLGVERDGIARALLRDADLGATQLFPPALPLWHQADQATLAPLRTDPAAARALLKAAGFRPGTDGILWRDGRRFAITLYTFVDRPELPLIASAIQEEMRQIGIAVRVVVGNSSDIPAGHRSGSLEMGLVARNFGTTPDPTATMVGDYANGGGDWGAMQWRDAALEAALGRLAAGAVDPAADRAVVATRLQTSLPVIPVVWYRQTIAVSNRVRNVSIDAFERSYRISDIQWNP